MATLVLAAAGSALGGAMGGSMVGLTTLALGKAAGATLGTVIDQRLLGLGAEPVESGKVDRFRIMGSSEGAVLPRIFGRMRVAGQIVWSSRFLESTSTQNVGGKGGGQQVREFSYSVSLAIALCEGEVTRIGRIWADGLAIEQAGLALRLHTGSEEQLPDPLIAALEGAETVPAYRGTAYVVFENLDLTPYGNRIPQFNFEVFRRSSVELSDLPRPPALDIRGVALVPGTGEYALATEQVRFDFGKGNSRTLNVHNDLGVTDIKASLGQLTAELPNAGSVSLVVSWFGSDLRCDRCALMPAVEQSEQDGTPMRWQVSGVGRAGAKVVNRIEDRPVFGGTPADASVLQAIRYLREIDQSVMFYPFILMDILGNNGLSDPWTGGANQPIVPWRGRITLSRAAGNPGSPDRTPDAAAEVAAFFGTAGPADFVVDGETIRYTGPEEWSYRRFILHYAHLCVLAGGVDAFCIGSEMRGLTQIRDDVTSYPAVRALCDLAADVRAILGEETRIGYASDWSEYFGHHPADGSGDVLFHLDPLWAHEAIDFIGIDNYMPLSDWRDGAEHADAAAGSVYNLAYLKANVAGGEGFDWYYADAASRDAQERRAIEDGAYGEDWVFCYKDLVSWWSLAHVDRVGGTKVGAPTAWVPRSKPIWFTELGCPAVNKGTNQPNVFHDPKSSESYFPYFSTGVRDDFIQYRYLQAMFSYWNDPANNPASEIYGGSMIDMTRAHVWAWDARPWPDFPYRMETWVDGDNYARGHWLNGRANQLALAEVVAEICDRAGLTDTDVSKLYGAVTGYAVEAVESARQSLQPLMLAYGFDSFSLDGQVAFANRDGHVVLERVAGQCVETGQGPVIGFTRAPASEMAGRVTLGYIRADMDYQSGAAEAIYPDSAEPNASQSSIAVVMTEPVAGAIAERWLSEGRVARDNLEFSLPPSDVALVPGDVFLLRTEERSSYFRVDRVDEIGHRIIGAVRVEPSIYQSPVYREIAPRGQVIAEQGAVGVEFLDLPLMTGEEVPYAPHVAVTRSPWSGSIAIFSANNDYGYSLNREISHCAVMGETLDPLRAAESGLWMPGKLRVRLQSGSLQGRSIEDVLSGANAAALRFGNTGDWEIIQFQEAELLAPREYSLRCLLRGQAGTDGTMPSEWPIGTDFILLDGAVKQIDLASAARGLQRHYRVGPSRRGYDDASYVHEVHAFAGVGLRPYRPVHLSARRTAEGDIVIHWIRRTRVDGDTWLGVDVPLGEEAERYHLRVLAEDMVIREFNPSAARLVYARADQLVDLAPAKLAFEVAQVSDRFGSGSYERIDFDG